MPPDQNLCPSSLRGCNGSSLAFERLCASEEGARKIRGETDNSNVQHQEARRSIIGIAAAWVRGSCAASSASRQARARMRCNKQKELVWMRKEGREGGSDGDWRIIRGGGGGQRDEPRKWRRTKIRIKQYCCAPLEHFVSRWPGIVLPPTGVSFTPPGAFRPVSGWSISPPRDLEHFAPT